MYMGQYLNNEQNGFGRFIAEEGFYYEGMWEDSEFHGLGTLVTIKGTQLTWQWVEGKLNGKNVGQLLYDESSENEEFELSSQYHED